MSIKEKSYSSPVKYIAWLYKYFGLPERLNTGKKLDFELEKSLCWKGSIEATGSLHKAQNTSSFIIRSVLGDLFQ